MIVQSLAGDGVLHDIRLCATWIGIAMIQQEISSTTMSTKERAAICNPVRGLLQDRSPEALSDRNGDRLKAMIPHCEPTNWVKRLGLYSPNDVQSATDCYGFGAAVRIELAIHAS